jgi:alkanesulfonate monooxygenase SsuD/methylene tetrahydromethanopterin reductase-like flavin-dependent oxidoreductase (luciferase family)
MTSIDATDAAPTLVPRPTGEARTAAPLGLSLGVPPSPAELGQWLACATVADDLGVDSLWLAEASGRDVVPFLTQLVLQTRRTRVGTGIINPFSRTPAMLAMTFATLDELSGGRMIIGLGSSSANVVEHWHGLRFKQPLRRIRETIEIVNQIVAGTPLQYEGEIFNLRRGLRLQFEPVRRHIPIYVAATTPPSIRQSGEVADGVMPIHWPRERLAELRRLLAEGAAAAGRSLASLTIAPSVNLVIAEHGDEAAMRAAREPIAHYAGRMGAFYPEMLTRYGYEAEVQAIRAAWERRDPAAAAAAVSDRLLQATSIAGTVEQCAESLRDLRAHGADLPIIPLPPGDPVVLGRTLERLLR